MMTNSSGATGPEGSATGQPAAPVIDISSLTKRYGRTLALDAISLSLKSGEMFALLGPNGAGKTTLIHILCTILRPDSGTATIFGHDVLREPLEARRYLGVVFQEPSLDSRLTVEENLEFHGMVHMVPAVPRRQRIAEVLELVDLADSRRQLVASLSPGMKRRLEIARALVHDARVLILDEPTIGLDAQSRERIWDYLIRIKAERKLTLIVTTHYIEEVERCDNVCIVDHGRILALETPDALRARHGREVVRVQPTNAEVAGRILARFPQAVRDDGGDIVVAGEGESVMDQIMSDFSTGIRQLSFERPTLESAFLNLVGHAADANGEGR